MADIKTIPTSAQRARLVQLSDPRCDLIRQKDMRTYVSCHGGTGGGWTYVMAYALTDAGWIEWRDDPTNSGNERAHLTQAGLDVIGGGKPAPWLEGWSLSPKTDSRFPIIHVGSHQVIINTPQGSDDVAHLMWSAPQLLRALENLLRVNSSEHRNAARTAIGAARNRHG